MKHSGCPECEKYHKFKNKYSDQRLTTAAIALFGKSCIDVDHKWGRELIETETYPAPISPTG